MPPSRLALMMLIAWPVTRCAGWEGEGGVRWAGPCQHGTVACAHTRPGRSVWVCVFQTYKHVHTVTHTYIYTHAYICIRAHTYTHTHAGIPAYITRMCLHTHACMHAQVHIQTLYIICRWKCVFIVVMKNSHNSSSPTKHSIIWELLVYVRACWASVVTWRVCQFTSWARHSSSI